MLERARRLPPPAKQAICHGDLHLRHLLVGDDGELSGVIDWIDVCRADPAIDLPLYWGYLTPAGRAAAFHAEYGPVAADALLRARVLAVFLWGVLAEYARGRGHAGARPRGARGPAPRGRRPAGMSRRGRCRHTGAGVESAVGNFSVGGKGRAR